MSMQKMMTKLEIMVRARYPLIYVVTHEEKRAEEALADLCKERNKQLFTWSITQGVVAAENTTENSGQVNTQTQDPNAALEHIRKFANSAVFVLKDFHAFMNDPRIIRKLRDLVVSLKTSYKTILILSPILKVPDELEKDITVLDMPLPTMDDLGNQLDAIIFSVRENSNIKIDLSNGQKEKYLQAAQGLTLTEAESIFAMTIVANKRLSAEDIPMILEEKKQIIRKSGLLEYYDPSATMEDIGGLDNLKQWLDRRSRAFTKKASDYGLPQPKGILMLGVSGSGKSLISKVISHSWNLPLLRLDMGSIFSGLVGSSEANVRAVIRTAESVAPCLLWLDEMDKGMSGASSSAFSDGGTTARVLSTFLTWMQEKKAPVFVIATANDISTLPPELLRKGRLDEIFFLDLPTATEREAIFEIHLKKRNRDPKRFDLPMLAGMTNGFSGAEIEQVVISAMYDSFDADRELENTDLVSTIRQTIPLSTTMAEGINQLRSWASTRARPASGESGDDIKAKAKYMELEG